MISFGTFLEHAAARFEQERRNPGPWYHVPPLLESHIFWLGDDKDFYDHIIGARYDILDEMKERIPMPFKDLTCVSIVDSDSMKVWTCDRIVEEPEYLFKLFEGGEGKNRAAAEKMKGQKLLIIRYQSMEVDGKLLPDPVFTWTIGYTGIVGDDVHFDLVPGRSLIDSGMMPGKKGKHSLSLVGLWDSISKETKIILDEVVAISHPANYIVQVTPKLTPHEERRVASGRPRSGQKARHFIVVDHEVLVRMRKEPTETHASPVPHHRRGHWKRLSERCRHARLMGKERVFVRPTFVGDPKWTCEKNFYEVLPDMNEKKAVSV